MKKIVLCLIVLAVLGLFIACDGSADGSLFKVKQEQQQEVEDKKVSITIKINDPSGDYYSYVFHDETWASWVDSQYEATITIPEKAWSEITTELKSALQDAGFDYYYYGYLTGMEFNVAEDDGNILVDDWLYLSTTDDPTDAVSSSEKVVSGTTYYLAEPMV